MTIRNKIQQLIKTGFLHIFGSSVINRLITFLSSVVLVRILTKDEYGTFTYAWNIYSILLLFNGFGMESGVLQICSEHGDDDPYCRKVCGFGLRFGLIFDLLLMAILLGLGLWMPVKIENANILLCMLCLLPAVQFIYFISTSYLRSQKRNRDYMHLTLLHTVLVFVTTALFSFIWMEKGIVVGYYVSFASAALFAFFAKGLRWSSGSGLSREDRKSLISIAFVSMCNIGLSQMMYLLDIFVLGQIDPQETILASYKVATTIPTALVFIPNALITYLYPYFAQHRGDGDWCLKRYKQILLGLGVVNAMVSLGMVILAPWVIQIFFGEAYLDAVPVFRILSVNYFFSGTFRILSGNLLVTQRKLKFNLMVALISGAVNVLADFLFIRWWGSIGAALATVLVVMVSGVLSTTYLIYTFKKNKKETEAS